MSTDVQPSPLRLRKRTLDLREWRSRLIDLVFPPQCVACHIALGDGREIQVCKDCREAVADSKVEPCARCGSRVATNPHTSTCRLCHGERFRFERAIALGNYCGRMRELIYQFKRRNQEPVAYQLGRLLGQQVRQKLTPGSEFNCVVPMPAHRFRQWTRGMNPALIVAEGVVNEIGNELICDLLQYRRHTEKQGTLSRTRRLENVKNAMRVNPRIDPRDLRVLLIDDVMASCATANEASRALRAQGVRKIFVAIVARGTGTNF